MREPYRQFVHCPRCAAPGPGEAGGNPFRCERCGLVLFFNAAAAVAVFITDPAGRVLYIRRSKDPGKDRLGMPGGFVDPGESAEEALRREVREEVGLEIGPLTYLGSWPNRYPYRDVVYITLDVFYIAPGIDPASARPLDAVQRVEWLDPVRVEPADIAFDSMRAALRQYLAVTDPGMGGHGAPPLR